MKRILKGGLSILLAITIIFSSAVVGLGEINFSGFFAVKVEAANKSEMVEFNGHYYEVFDESMTWNDAKNKCEDLGGHLATITSQEEQNLVGELVNKGKKKSYWLGGKINNSVWSWITGEKFSYTHWYPGEPNSSGNYMQIFSPKSNYSSISNGWDNTTATGDRGGGIKYSEIGFVCEWDEYSGIDESFVMQAAMPTLSHQDAVNFLSFLYNKQDSFEGVDITGDIQYQLLTGNLPDDMTVDEIKGLIVAFLCIVDRLTNAQINEYKYKTNYLYEVLVARLEEEVGGMSNLDEQIINQEMGRFSKYIEDGLVDIGTGIISRTAGIIFTEEVFDNIGNVLSGISKTKDVASKITDMVNYTIDGVLLYGMALGQENVARVSYFNSYINLRGLNETAFRAGIDSTFDALEMSYPLSKLLNLLTWFTKKDSWTNHRADIDRWAEYVYQLGQYQKQDFHKYESIEYPATCTTDGYTYCECLYCDKSFTADVVKAQGHKYIKTAVASLCEEQGYDLYKCKVCGDSYKENYKDALGHSVYKQEIVEPTCKNKGYILNYCKCGYEWVSDEKDALEHNYVLSVVEPTETKQGYTISNCSICGDIYYSDYVNPKGHSYVVTETLPTCETSGTIVHTCDCGESYTEEIPAKGHNYVLDSINVPTCTQQGVKTYKCTDCDNTYTETLDKLSHDYSYKMELTEPTCDAQGYCTHYCSCGTTSATDYVDALGHTYETISTVDATCTSEGSVTTECSVCGHTYTEIIPALGDGHNYILIESSSLGCVISQYDLYECSVCGIQKYENIIAAEGHTYDTCDTIPATCTQDGSRTFYCTTCNETITEILPKTNHDKNEWESSDSGVENELVRKCNVCGIVVEKSTDIRSVEWYVNGQHIVDYLPIGCVIAPPQTFNENGYEFSHWYPETPPLAIGEDNLTFTAVYSNESNTIYVIDDFSYEYDSETNTVTICGYLGTDEHILLPEKILEYDVIGIAANAIPANVTQITIPETVTNIHSNAFNSATKLQKINVNENNAVYTDIDGVLYSKDKTELVRLSVAYQGDFEFSENITTIGECAFYGHVLSEDFYVPETVTSIKKSAFSKCSGIKYVFYTGTQNDWSKISIGSDNACLTNAYVHYETMEHIYFDQWTVDIAPTCTEVGSKSHKCKFCDCKIDVTEVPATGHNYSDEWTTDLAPTCTKEGSKSHHCANCGDKADVTSINALGHDYSAEWTIDTDATCTTDGSKSRHCSRCTDKIDVTVIPAKGHNYSTEWTIDLEPTCTEKGSKSHHCTDCDEKIDVTAIVAMGHDYKVQSVENTHPHTTVLKCSVCEEEITKESDCIDCKFILTLMPSNTYTLALYLGTEADVVVPSNHNGTPITAIGDKAFYQCSYISKVTLPKGVVSIGEYAFSGCKNFSECNISNSVESIGDYAFENCSFREVTIPENVKNVGRCAFRNNINLKVVNYNAISAGKMGAGSFLNSTYFVFAGCNLETLNIGEDVQSIPSHSFRGASIDNVIFAENCKLTSIGTYSFNSNSITSIIIPISVIEIGNNAFEYCDSLRYVFYSGSESEWNNITIGSNNESLTDVNVHYNLTEHILKETVSYPTCTATGVIHNECTICEFYTDEVIPLLEHNYSDEWTIDNKPTCIMDGWKSHHCIDCGDRTDITSIQATGHISGVDVVTREPTCTRTGSKYQLCSVCEFKSIITIPA